MTGRSHELNPLAPARGFRVFDKQEIEQPIGKRFEKVARDFPHRPAVSASGITWTYDEIERRTTAVAHSILERRPEVSEAVAVMLPIGPDLAAAILGVLRAGKYYLGIDPNLPSSFARDVLVDTGARLIITTTELLPAARNLAEDQSVALPIDAIDLSDSTANRSFPDASPDDLAYVFYTSGTTGRPKGVMDNQRNVLHNVMRYTNSLGISATDRMSLMQSVSFSGSVSSLFGALLNGACCCPFDARGKTAAQLAEWLKAEQISIYHSVPSIFRYLMTSDTTLPDIRAVRLEGDQTTKGDLDLFCKNFSSEVRLVNGLGTTETGLVSQFFANPDTRVSTPVVPVGYPVEDMDFLVLSDNAKPAPAGEVGEIAVRSRYLAVGYWKDPSLTADRFETDSNDPALRTYRTGDLGRTQPDGCLEHLGRKDTRVKIHGRQIELVDVDAAVQALPAIREAATAVRTNTAGREVLVAYYVVSEPPGPTVSELRQSLSASLPADMMPMSFMELAALPHSGNGKLDRAALPLPNQDRPRLAYQYLHPRSMLEYQLKTLWERAIGTSPIGVRDDFFDVGGDSLAAMSMATFVQEELGVDLSPGQLLASATIEALASSIHENAVQIPAPLVELQHGAAGSPPFFYLHGDYLSGGYYTRKLARALGSDVRFIAVTPCGSEGTAPPKTFEEMAVIHLRHLREVQPSGPYYLGGTCNGGLIAYEMARHLVRMGERVELLALFAANSVNVRFAALARCVHVLGNLLGHSPDQQRFVFARLREMAVNFDGLGWIGALRRAFTKMPRIPHELRSLTRPSQAMPGTDAPDVRDHYLFAEDCYIPARYDGPLLVLWPEGESDSAEQVAKWWRRVAPAVEVKCLPSSHHACLTADAGLLGGALSEALVRARGNSAGGPAAVQQSV